MLSGSASRTISTFTVEKFGGQRPRISSLTDKDKKYIEEVVARLTSFKGEVSCPKVARAIDKWLDERACEALETNSKPVDFFRRRAAVIGYRAGLLAYVLEGEKEARVVVDFAVWVAETVMRNQIALWGELLEEDAAMLCASMPKRNIYKSINDMFTFAELRQTMGMGVAEMNVRQVICRWKKAGLIEKTGTNTYRKIGK